MPLNNLLPIFLLAVAGTDFLGAMHPPGEAEPSDAASSSNIETEPHHHGIDYEGKIGNVRVGSSGEPTEFLFVDTHEKKVANDYFGCHLELKDLQIRLGNKQLNSVIHEHKSPYAARIKLALNEQQNSDLKAPKDLEGIELEIEYGFKYQGESYNNYWFKLSNERKEKKVTVKIPKHKNAVTVEEKEILKGIFIGGHKFRVEVQKDGNAEIKFQKNLTPGTIKFTASYSNFYSEKGQMVKEPYAYGECELENISLAKSTFTINWAKSGIKEAEELRTVRISIFFKLQDGKHLKVPDNQLGVWSSSVAFQDLSNDTLEKIYVGGGEATIDLSLERHGNYKIAVEAPVKKPKSSAFETVKASLGFGM